MDVIKDVLSVLVATYGTLLLAEAWIRETIWRTRYDLLVRQGAFAVASFRDQQHQKRLNDILERELERQCGYVLPAPRYDNTRLTNIICLRIVRFTLWRGTFLSTTFRTTYDWATIVFDIADKAEKGER